MRVGIVEYNIEKMDMQDIVCCIKSIQPNNAVYSVFFKELQKNVQPVFFVSTIMFISMQEPELKKQLEGVVVLMPIFEKIDAQFKSQAK